MRPDRLPRWGRMSAHQMICHLSDAIRMMTGEKSVRVTTDPLRRTVVKWIALYVPLPWPRGIPTSPEIDQLKGGTKPVAFTSDLAQLEALVTAVPTSGRRLDGHAHPIFGSMSEAAWLRWAYLHLNHHLRQFGV